MWNIVHTCVGVPPPHLPLPIQSIINFRHINKQPQTPTACDNKAPQLRVVSYPPWWWVACGGADTEELDDAAEEGTGGEEGGQERRRWRGRKSVGRLRGRETWHHQLSRVFSCSLFPLFFFFFLEGDFIYDYAPSHPPSLFLSTLNTSLLSFFP